MCNRVHKDPENDFKSIPFSGIGWKIVHKINGKHHSVCLGPQFTEITKAGYFKWITLYSGDGFCFFRTKKMAEKALSVEWLHDPTDICAFYYLVKIKYRGGLGSFIETTDKSWLSGTRFAICTEFKFVD